MLPNHHHWTQNAAVTKIKTTNARMIAAVTIMRLVDAESANDGRLIFGRGLLGLPALLGRDDRLLKPLNTYAPSPSRPGSRLWAVYAPDRTIVFE
jgi:hypothetical protein